MLSGAPAHAAYMSNATPLLPQIVTEQLAETRKYYIDIAGFTPAMEQEDFLMVRLGDEENGAAFAFVPPNVGPEDMHQPPFAGKGLVMSVPTPDADAKYKELKARGAKLLSEPTNRPWGWRSFAAVDPNGVVLDFYSIPEEASGADAQS